MEKKIIFEGNNFITTKLIGEGGFGKVYLGKTKDTNQICAIKEIDLNKNKERREKMIRELQIMKKIKHKNCIELFFIEPKDYQNVDLIYVVMEYCDLGDLNGYLRTKSSISLEEVKEIFGQIVLGLKYLSQKRIVHRDLKPKNILLQSNNNSKFGYTIKLADFGFARKIPKDDLEKSLEMEIQIGTPLYVAPEIFVNQSYSLKVDLWSLGAILYELITGNPLIQYLSIKQIMFEFQNSTNKSLPDSYLEKVPKECHDLVERLLTVDPNLRITREELYKHPFISEKLNELIGDSNTKGIDQNSKKLIGIAKIDSQSDENDDNFLSFSKGDEVEIIEIDGKMGIGKLNGKKGEIFINDFDIKEN
ncbi:serine/threonine-protein kinase ulk3 [Anaeramoeba ignava]|uniref:Serine/threonine-protein kinase ulk3 n=1 Tax=Anaeramoeba ignava TaxID=1746090 RepID=A0A9Q0LPZ3_ANAIG|nr:serine/threonine-protein kinase ulk3 [Anaeramoeba ignava]